MSSSNGFSYLLLTSKLIGESISEVVFVAGVPTGGRPGGAGLLGPPGGGEDGTECRCHTCLLPCWAPGGFCWFGRWGWLL